MHLRQLNVDVALISAVGDDRLGHELRRRLHQAGVDCALLAVQKKRETGFVLAELQANGNASYTILRHVAWDLLPIVPMPDPIPPRAIVYSSLVMRTDQGLQRLKAWFQSAPEAIRIFDVNLRPPHYQMEVIEAQLFAADWIKANYEEACEILSFSSKEPVELAMALQKRFQTSLVLLTHDAKGAGVLVGSDWHWVPAPVVDVVDTIGAGDAFLATFVAQYLLAQAQRHTALEQAVLRASRVVQYSGAVPDLG